MKKRVELIIDEQEFDSGIDAVSVVEHPAIEENFIALNQHPVKLAEIDKEKRILMGCLLVPDRDIPRIDENGDIYYIFFSKETVRKCMELFFIRSNQNNSTLEHRDTLNGLTVVESWIVEDAQMDKTALYNLNAPIGAWVGSVKVNNPDVWDNYVKTGIVKGFSIEGYFADKAKLSKCDDDVLDEILAGLELLRIKFTLNEIK